MTAIPIPNRDGNGADSNPNRARKEADPNPNKHTWADMHGTNAPYAYLITFRTYATWLPGDTRGTVDRLHNQPGTPLLPPNTELECRAMEQAGLSFELTPAQRRVVERTIAEVCEHRRWELHEMNVRTNHVHLVVSGAETPEKMLNTFKAWSTRRLRESGLLTNKMHTWSRHGSTRYIWKADQMEAACCYVRDAQDAERPACWPLPHGRGSDNIDQRPG